MPERTITTSSKLNQHKTTAATTTTTKTNGKKLQCMPLMLNDAIMSRLSREELQQG
jgi:hypothetical protein